MGISGVFMHGMPGFGAACILLKKLGDHRCELFGGLRNTRATDGD
jgi:hypothetical protein